MSLALLLTITALHRTVKDGVAGLQFTSDAPVTSVYVAEPQTSGGRYWQHAATISCGRGQCFVPLFEPSLNAANQGSVALPISVGLLEIHVNGVIAQEPKLYCTIFTGNVVPTGCPCLVLAPDPAMHGSPWCEP